MLIFNIEAAFNSKVNFADKNNVCVGYDMGQDCCEYAGWFITETKELRIYGDDYNHIERPIPDVSDYVFDKTFIEEVNSPDVDAGQMVRFRLINGDKELFLHIFNSHNGYYGHGFTFMNNDTLIQEGTL